MRLSTVVDESWSTWQCAPVSCRPVEDPALAAACTLQVVLFQDAFVCRHVNKANQWVEGFAQPYDSESR